MNDTIPMEGIVQIQIDDLLLSVDMETANQLENDMQFRQQYINAVKRQLVDVDTNDADGERRVNDSTNISNNIDVCEIKSTQPVWTSSKNQTDHDRAATLCFLSLRKKYSQEFQDKVTNKNSIWSKIAAEINSQNFYIGDAINGRERCRQKFANLQASYVRFIDRRRQTGEGKIPKPPFFDDLDEILGDKHKIVPVLIIDSEIKYINSDVKNANTKETIEIPSQPSTSNNAIRSSEDNDHHSNSFNKKGNKFVSVKSSVRPDKNKLLQKFVEISQENTENNKRQFSDLMSYLREEGERRHQQTMGIIEAMRSHKKRKRDDSDSD